MILEPGARLGKYEVLGPLGSGGMGEVYRARDSRLERDVAVKVLRKDVSQDPDRLARFEREAKLLAALNHPNIATIHELEEWEGVRFLIMELVPGDTLAEKLATQPLSLGERLRIAHQLAEGITAAHQRGIIHRDLKPANVKVTPESRVKILDFGLAKDTLIRQLVEASAPSDSATLTYGGTAEGVILGTPTYMSPEQARGQPLDGRTDVWSFGCIVYEMFSGRRAFDGETVTDVLAAVVTRDPDWTRFPPETPPRLLTLVRQCLAKDLHARLATMSQACQELERVREEVPSIPVAAFAGLPAPPPSVLPAGPMVSENYSTVKAHRPSHATLPPSVVRVTGTELWSHLILRKVGGRRNAFIILLLAGIFFLMGGASIIAGLVSSWLER